MAGEHDSPAHRPARRADAPSRPGSARSATSPPTRHAELTRHRTRPPRREQPRLPYGEPMYTVDDGPKVVALTIDDGPATELGGAHLRRGLKAIWKTLCMNCRPLQDSSPTGLHGHARAAGQIDLIRGRALVVTPSR